MPVKVLPVRACGFSGPRNVRKCSKQANERTLVIPKEAMTEHKVLKTNPLD